MKLRRFKGVFAPALFKQELLRERHPRPHHCVAALGAVDFELATNIYFKLVKQLGARRRRPAQQGFDH